MSKVDSSAKGSFWHFRKLCERVGSNPSRTHKTTVIREFLDTYDGDLLVFIKLMLPKQTKRVYNMSTKKMTKLFSRVFTVSESHLNDCFNKGPNAGRISDLIAHEYAALDDGSFTQRNQKRTILSMKQVNDYLDHFTQLTKADDQYSLLLKVVMQCNIDDLRWFVRQLNRDLKIDAGSKAVLDGIHSGAYEYFGSTADLNKLVKKINDLKSKYHSSVNGDDSKGHLTKKLTVQESLMHPVKPMLAQALKSYAGAFVKCPSGKIFAEIKYDGERIQVHFDGQGWKYYSRSLKEASEDKIGHIKDAVTASFGQYNQECRLMKQKKIVSEEDTSDSKSEDDECEEITSMILDSEILMLNLITGEPEKFGSLGKHKKLEFENAVPCLFVFDILHLNGRSLIKEPLHIRRGLLERMFKPVENALYLSKMTIVKNEDELQLLMEDVIQRGLEGLVLKDSESVYKPNARHWLKLKRDYLGTGELADSVDLLVLGAFRGSGKHGGLYSTFLMGVLDHSLKKFSTVCKVHNGLDDEQLKQYTESIDMVDYDPNQPPGWLNINPKIKPDWVCKNPKKSPVFEITGFEFSESNVHTATDHEGQTLSIRFPRVTKIRDDKTYKTATNQSELKHIVKESRVNPMYKADESKKNASKQAGKKRKSPSKNEDSPSPKGTTPIVGGASAASANGKGRESSLSVSSCDDGLVDSKLPPKKRIKTKNDVDMVMEESKMDSMMEISPLPPQPKPKADTRKHCPYDSDCYRKNPTHFTEFQHPLKEESELEKATLLAQSALKQAQKTRDQIIQDGVKAAEAKKQEMIQDAQKEAEDYFLKRVKKIKIDQVDAYADIARLYHPA